MPPHHHPPPPAATTVCLPAAPDHLAPPRAPLPYYNNAIRTCDARSRRTTRTRAHTRRANVCRAYLPASVPAFTRAFPQQHCAITRTICSIRRQRDLMPQIDIARRYSYLAFTTHALRRAPFSLVPPRVRSLRFCLRTLCRPFGAPRMPAFAPAGANLAACQRTIIVICTSCDGHLTFADCGRTPLNSGLTVPSNHMSPA